MSSGAAGIGNDKTGRGRKRHVAIIATLQAYSIQVCPVGVHISSETFLYGFRDSFQLSDFVNGLIKAGVFGFIIGIVGCYQGFSTRGGAQGVGKATTASVVISTVLILVFNFIFAVILFRI